MISSLAHIRSKCFHLSQVVSLDSDVDSDSFLDNGSSSSESSSASLAEEEEEDDDGDYDEMPDSAKLTPPSPLVTRESRRQCRKKQVDIISQCGDVFSPTIQQHGETIKRRHCSMSKDYVWTTTTATMNSRPTKRAADKFLQSLRQQENSLLREWVPSVGRAGPLACSIWAFVDGTYFRSIDPCFAAHLLGLGIAPLSQNKKRKSEGIIDDWVNGTSSTHTSTLPLFRLPSNDPAFQTVPLGPRLKRQMGSGGGGGILPFFIPGKKNNSVVRAHAICRIMPDLKNLDTPTPGGGSTHYSHRRTPSSNSNVAMESGGRVILLLDEVAPKSFHVHSDPKLGSTTIWQVNDGRTAGGAELSKKQQEVFALRPPILQILHWWSDPDVVSGGGPVESSNAAECMGSGEKSIVSEIEEAQRELRLIMARNEKVAQSLICKVRKEEGIRVLTSAEDETLAKWTRIMQIAAEEKIAEQQKQEEDMNAVCYVCGGGDSPHNDPIIFCDRCDLAVHRSCYFLPTVPSDDWYCWPCKDQVVVGNADAIGDTLPVHDKGPHDVSCVLCPVRGGAYLPTDCHLHTDKNSNALADGNVVDVRSGGGSTSAPRRSWAHAACAGWGGLVPDAWAGGIVRCKQWLRDANYRNLAEGRCCIFCGGTKGAITKCSQNRCPTSYHVSCALKSYRDECGEGQRNHVVLKRDRRRWGCWSSFCSRHSSNNNLPMHNGGLSGDVKLLSSSSNTSPPRTTRKLVPPNRTVSSYGRTRSTVLGATTTAANDAAARPRDKPPPQPQREAHPLLRLTNTPVGGERLCQICSRSDPRGLWQCSGTPQRPCTVVVHWRCYRGSVKHFTAAGDDEEELLPHFCCDSCLEYEMVSTVEEVDSVEKKEPSHHSCSASSTVEILQRECVLCPMRQGAFLRTSKGLWVHALCALCCVSARYVPPGPVDILHLETSVTPGGCKADAEPSPSSAPADADAVIQEDDDNQYCQLCGLKGRPYVDLARCCFCTGKCDVFMHATCASSAGCSFPTSSCASRLRTEKSQHGPTSHIKRGSLLSVLCPKHRWEEDGLASQLRSLCELSHKLGNFSSTAMKEKGTEAFSLLPKEGQQLERKRNLPYRNTQKIHSTSGPFLPFLDRWSRALVQFSWLSRTAVNEVDWMSAKYSVGPLQNLCLQQKAMASGARLCHIILNGDSTARQMGAVGAELGILLSTLVFGYFTVYYISYPSLIHYKPLRQ